MKTLEKYVKTNSYKNIPCRVLEILSEMNFTNLNLEDLPKKRKRNEDTEDKQKSQEVVLVTFIQNQKTLREVLSIYFFIIKKSYNSPLLIPTLKGLSKFCGMLNIEIVLDLVKNLLSLLKENKVKGENKFYCIHSCIKIISSTSHALNYEDKDLSQVLYNSLLSPPIELNCQKIFIESLSWLLLKQKQYSYDLVSAFIKRILQVAFHCDIKLMKALLCVGKQMLSKFPKAYMLLEFDEDDDFNPTVKEAYSAQAASSTILPELKAFANVFDAQVSQIVKTYYNKNAIDKKPLDYLF